MGNDLRGTARATDGHEIAVTRFAAATRPWGNVLVAGAMGVRQDFYAPFARFLAGSGLNVFTFDYRGMGWSQATKVGAIDTDVLEWARKDLAAMLAQARIASPHLPLVLVGHSLGGQIFALASGHENLRAALNVTAGVGDYRLNDRMPIRLRLLWHVLVPLLTPLFGYFPGKRLRLVGDLPRGVAWQWRRWCMHPDYLVSEGEWARAALAGVRMPILSYSFEDDIYIVRRAVEHLDSFYRNARIEHRHVDPASIGAASIGHMGFFSEKRRADLWADALEWLRRNIEARPQGGDHGDGKETQRSAKELSQVGESA